MVSSDFSEKLSKMEKETRYEAIIDMLNLYGDKFSNRRTISAHEVPNLDILLHEAAYALEDLLTLKRLDDELLKEITHRLQKSIEEKNKMLEKELNQANFKAAQSEIEIMIKNQNLL